MNEKNLMKKAWSDHKKRLILWPKAKPGRSRYSFESGFIAAYLLFEKENKALKECSVDMLNRLEFAKEVIPSIRGERKKFYDDCCKASLGNYRASRRSLRRALKGIGDD